MINMIENDVIPSTNRYIFWSRPLPVSDANNDPVAVQQPLANFLLAIFGNHAPRQPLPRHALEDGHHLLGKQSRVFF